MVRQAKCCCGQVTVTVAGDPAIQGICHCDNCKRRTGSAFGWSSYFRESQIVDMTGDTTSYHIDSANRQDRFFCARCGSTVYWRTTAFEGLLGVAGGCFTDDPRPEPKVTVANNGRYSWLSLPKDWKRSL